MPVWYTRKFKLKHRSESQPDSDFLFEHLARYGILKAYLSSNHTDTMAKRSTSLSPKKKSKGSHKTAKRLAVKKTMLAKKSAKKKTK